MSTIVKNKFYRKNMIEVYKIRKVTDKVKLDLQSLKRY